MNDFSYEYWNSISDKAILETIGGFVQHHRLNQNRSQGEVSKAAGISRSTLSLLERGEKVSLNTLIQVLRVLDNLHVINAFKVTEEISPIEYAKLQKKKRQRAGASSNNKVEEPKLEW